MVVVSILWIPVITEMQGGQLYIYIQSICAYMAPPIASVYCMSILWPRANEKVSDCAIMHALIVTYRHCRCRVLFGA